MLTKILKKFLIYISAAAAFIATLKGIIGVTFSWQIAAIICCSLIPAVLAFIFFEERNQRLPWDAKRTISDSSLLLSIVDGLNAVRFAPSNDEEIAYIANKIVKRCLDKRSINYNDYAKWRKKNPNIFTAVLNVKNTMIGFFDIFPLTDNAAKAIIEGKRSEKSLKIDDILSPGANDEVNFIYIATIMVNPFQDDLSPTAANDVILLKFEEFISEVYRPLEKRTFIAFAHTKEGQNLAKRCNFSLISLPNTNPQKDPLYMLEGGKLKQVLSRFQNIRKRLCSRQAT